MNYLFYLSVWLVVLIGMFNWRIAGLIEVIEEGSFELNKNKLVILYGVIFVYTLIAIVLIGILCSYH